MRVAVDTNVLVSASIADGPPRRILEILAEGDHELILPAPVLGELRRVLEEKIGLLAGRVEELVALVQEVAVEIPPCPEDVEALSGDPDDDRILASAIGAGAEILVSGDAKHLLPLGRVGKLRILRPTVVLADLVG